MTREREVLLARRAVADDRRARDDLVAGCLPAIVGMARPTVARPRSIATSSCRPACSVSCAVCDATTRTAGRRSGLTHRGGCARRCSSSSPSSPTPSCSPTGRCANWRRCIAHSTPTRWPITVMPRRASSPLTAACRTTTSCDCWPSIASPNAPATNRATTPTTPTSAPTCGSPASNCAASPAGSSSASAKC